MTNEEEAYEWYLDRLSMPPSPIPLSKEECEAYNKKHALPAKEELDRILKDAGVVQLLATSQKIGGILLNNNIRCIETAILPVVTTVLQS